MTLHGSVHMMARNISSGPAKRQQLYAERKKNGLIVVPCVCVELDVVDVLQELGFLELGDPTRRQISDALSKYVYQEMTRQQRRLEGMR
jgi:hypothetical protein